MGPTAKQRVVRSAFKKSCNCFNRQLDAGGATPPAIGPRNKSWWHTDSLPSGLRYYTYFMHKTIPPYLLGTIPDWCAIWTGEDSYVQSGIHADGNYGGGFLLAVKSTNLSDIHLLARTFIKTPQFENKNLHVYCYYTFNSEGDVAWRNVDAHRVDPDAWDEDTITWNNKPAIGEVLDSQIVTSTGWWTFDIGNAKSICLKYTDESAPPSEKGVFVGFSSKEKPGDDPYITEY